MFPPIYPDIPDYGLLVRRVIGWDEMSAEEGAAVSPVKSPYASEMVMQWRHGGHITDSPLWSCDCRGGQTSPSDLSVVLVMEEGAFEENTNTDVAFTIQIL